MIAHTKIRKDSNTADFSMADHCLPLCSLNLSPHQSTTDSCSSSDHESAVYSRDISNTGKDLFQKQIILNLKSRILKLYEQKTQMEEKFKTNINEITSELQVIERENLDLKVAVHEFREDMKDMRGDIAYLRNKISGNSTFSMQATDYSNNQRKASGLKNRLRSQKALKLYKTSSVKVK